MCLWNELPVELREPRRIHFHLIYHTWQFIIVTIFTITTFIFSYSFSQLKTWLFGKSFPPQTYSSPTGLILRTIKPFIAFILLNRWICLHDVLD